MVAAVQTVGAAILPGCLGYRGLSRRGIGRHSLDFGLGGGARRGTRLHGADSFPRISNPCFPSASRAFDVTLPDRRASFSSFVFSMPYLMRATWIGDYTRSSRFRSGKRAVEQERAAGRA